MPRKKSLGLTSDYAQTQAAAYASMTPAQRADYQQRGAMLGVGIPAAAAAFALNPTAAIVGGTIGALSILTAQRVIAPEAKPKPRTRRNVRGGGR